MTGLLVHDDLHSILDDRTLEILEHRRQTARIRRRGWLVRRMLVLADVVALLLAFAVAELLYPHLGRPEAFATWPEVEMLAVYVIVIAVLVLRPAGLFARAIA